MLEEIVCGVPQGPLLGPKLFILNIFIIDIITIFVRGWIQQFVDYFFCSMNDLQMTTENMVYDLFKR